MNVHPAVLLFHSKGNKGGFLLFELGINQSEYVKELMSKNFEEIEITKDLAGIDRVISGKLIY